MYSKEVVTKEFKVKSLINGEHTFEAATYLYSLDKDEASPRIQGIATNNPRDTEIPSTRVYILGNSWHFVNFSN